MSIQSEFSSFKLLLKQVYSAHSTKVKELENEIKLLKEKLTEKERETNISVADCKRCIKLEEAFKACKKTLHEQSKWCENFGQKFSIFNSSELENRELKDLTKSSNYAQDVAKTSRNFKSDMTIHNIDENDVDLLNHVDNAEKLSILSNNQNLLKKVMLDDGEGFDVYTVTFNQNLKHDNVNIKSDSMILAPDSLSTALDIKKVSETEVKECNIREREKSKKVLKSVETENCKGIARNYQENKVACKRLSSEILNEDRFKRVNKGDLLENSSEIIKTKDISSDIIVPKIVVTSEFHEISKNVDSKTKAPTDFNAKSLSKKKNTVTEIMSNENKNKTVNNVPLGNNSVNDIKNKSTSYQTSPSLLPTHSNIPPKIINLEPISNDDDFQEQVPSSKPLCSQDSWDSSVRKKSSKKHRNVKCIKSTSKYKMTLDAPPLNCKKPIYKQTKLSKSIFHSKTPESNNKSPEEPIFLKYDSSSVKPEKDYFPTVLQDHFQSPTPGYATKSPTVVDIDATFIPENFKFESSHYNTTNVKKNTVENSLLKNGLFSNISFPEELKSSVKNDENSFVNVEEINNSSSLEDIELKENAYNSFDRLPLPEEPNYKYKNDVVRKKSERKQLNGFDCKECEKYYSELGLNDREKKERMKKCSRHRGKYTPPATPDHFWELDFPDTEECKARGYLNKTQKVKLNNICNI